MGDIIKSFSKFFNVFLTLAIFVIVGGLIFLYSYPFDVAQFKKITILNTVNAGGLISYDVDYCRYLGKGVDVQVRRFLIPEDPNLDPIELSSNPNLETIDGVTGCRTTKKPITLPIEVSTPAGEYKLKIQARYCIFVGRCIPVEGESPIFTIGKPSINDQLTVINQQISSINDYVVNNPEEIKALGNTVIPQSISVPTQPNVTQPTTAMTPQSTEKVQPSNVNPQQTASTNDIQAKGSILDLTLGLPILKLIK